MGTRAHGIWWVMWVGLIGPMSVHDGDREVALPAGNQRIVLATLVLRANHTASLDELANTVWGEHPPRAAEATLRNYVKRLRRVLGPAAGRVATRAGGYLLRLEDSELDLTLFEELCRQSAIAGRERDWLRARAASVEALRLWRGVPLLDVPSQVLRDEVVPRFEQLRLRTVETRLEAELQSGEHSAVIPELQTLAHAYPLRESFHGLLMRALYRDGRQAEALAAYRAARRLLVDELGCEPGAELRELHLRILRNDPDLAAAQHGGSIRVVPRELPGAVRLFIGRHDELKVLDGLPDEAGDVDGAAQI